MSDHYYSKDPTSSEEKYRIYAELRGQQFQFYTGSGVFSKKGIDYGTRLLVETAELPTEGKVLDLGCGYGPIGIACARFVPDSVVTLVDINQRAVQLAKENACINGVEDQVTVLWSDGFSAVKDQRFDVIMTNPPIRTGKKEVYEMFANARAHLVSDGVLWVVIRKKQGAASAFDELVRLFLNVEVRHKKKGYWILRASRAKWAENA